MAPVGSALGPAGRDGPAGAARGFVLARLDRTGTLGLALTLQLILLVALTTWFGVLTEDVAEQEELTRLDAPVAEFLTERRTPWLTDAFVVLTYLGSWWVLAPALLALGWAVRRTRGSWWPLAFLAAALAGAGLAGTVTKLLVARPRPETGALVEALGFGFPSGHSTAAAAGWLAAALVLARLTRRVAARVAVTAVALGAVVVVGASRVYLGVHEATDVLAGWALGAGWVTAVLVAVRVVAARRSGGEPVQGR